MKRDLQPTDVGLVGECTECNGQMVETSVTYGSDRDGDRSVVQLRCRECDAEGRIEYERRVENPWEDPSVQEGVSDLSVEEIRWIDCPRCHGHGEIEDPLCDLRRAMNGREHPCPECHRSGRVPHVVMTDGGNDEPREQALAATRDALAALNAIPAAGLDAEKAKTVIEVAETVQALEKQLTNEVSQVREVSDE